MKRFGSFKGSRVRASCENACEPKTRDDLVVNKNRVKDLSDWLDTAALTSRPSLLLLTGPAGCGKTATIRVLAAEKGIQVVDWITPVDTFECWSDADELKPVNLKSRFRTFLLGAGRYSSVIVEKSKSSNNKLIIVKDFPLPLLSAPDDFRELVDIYVSRCSSPVVFICTDSVSKKTKDIAYDLFTEDFKLRHGIHHVSFTPVAVTFVVKALKRVVQIMMWGVTDDVIRQVAEESCGDVRKAVNSLSVISVGGKFRCVSTGRTKKGQDSKKSGSKSSKDADGEVTGLFHAVGRVLYAKRENTVESSTQSQYGATEGEFVHKPMDIVGQYSHYAIPFVSLAHSNYLDIFSSIDSITKASENLSLSDVIMAEWRDKEILSTIGFTVAVTGLMEANKDPIRKWKPLRGSQWNEDIKQASVNHYRIQDLFSDYCAAKLDLYLNILPSITQMWSRKNSHSNLTKCKYGFLPHKTSDLLETVRKIKSDTFTDLPAEVVEEDKDTHEDDDMEYNISDVSE